GVEDAEKAYHELKAAGAKILHGPANYPWALEIRVEDPDGNVLRLGSDSLDDRPYDVWRTPGDDTGGE
ncbi:MAG: VOC family protein, partial [Blastocatellia bacterium]